MIKVAMDDCRTNINDEDDESLCTPNIEVTGDKNDSIAPFPFTIADCPLGAGHEHKKYTESNGAVATEQKLQGNGDQSNKQDKQGTLPVMVLSNKLSAVGLSDEIVTTEDVSFLLRKELNGHSRKKLLVLDINGLLVDIVSPQKNYKADISVARKAVFKRPFCLEFLKFCFEKFEVGVWSSRKRQNVDKVVDYLMGNMRQNLLFCWDISQCTVTKFRTLENRHKQVMFKDLRKLWEKSSLDLPWEKGYYDEFNTLLLDDSPYKALLNPAHTAIFPFPYQFQDENDQSLGDGGDLRVYLEGVVAADNVQEYVAEHPFGQMAITEQSPSWDFYLNIIGTISPFTVAT